MSVYTFEKSFQQRLDEIKLILEEGGSTKECWRNFLEVSIEPAGYSAIWKISRGDCESLNIKVALINIVIVFINYKYFEFSILAKYSELFTTLTSTTFLLTSLWRVFKTSTSTFPRTAVFRSRICIRQTSRRTLHSMSTLPLTASIVIAFSSTSFTFLGMKATRTSSEIFCCLACNFSLT